MSRRVPPKPPEQPASRPARIRMDGLAQVRHALAEWMRPAIPGPRLPYRQVPGREGIVSIADRAFDPASGARRFSVDAARRKPPQPRFAESDTCADSRAEPLTGPATAQRHCRLNGAETRAIRGGANRSDTVADSRRCPCALEEHVRPRPVQAGTGGHRLGAAGRRQRPCGDADRLGQVDVLPASGPGDREPDRGRVATHRVDARPGGRVASQRRGGRRAQFGDASGGRRRDAPPAAGGPVAPALHFA